MVEVVYNIVCFIVIDDCVGLFDVEMLEMVLCDLKLFLLWNIFVEEVVVLV